MSTPLLTGCTDTDAKGKPCKGRISWERVVLLFRAQGPDHAGDHPRRAAPR